MPPFIVFSDIALKQMCMFYPTTKENMLNINGVGSLKFEKYGNIFIETINDYIAANNITPPDLSLQPKKSKKTSSTKVDTVAVTYDLFKQGKTIKDIADERHLSPTTIEGHLLKCYEIGKDVDLTSYIHSNFKEEIFSAIQTFGTDKLRTLKDALPEDVSYLDIKYYIIQFNNKTA